MMIIHSRARIYTMDIHREKSSWIIMSIMDIPAPDSGPGPLVVPLPDPNPTSNAYYKINMR